MRGAGLGRGAEEAVAALGSFRRGWYSVLQGWADALFELTDAVVCAPGPVSSVPQLSLEPEFSRSHGSLYKALAEGRIDEAGLRRLLVAHRPRRWPMVFAVDASTWARKDAQCSPGRGFHYSAAHHSAGQPVVAGWSYQWISQLSWANDSWTAPADVQRLPPTGDPTAATVEQVRRLVGLLPAGGEVPLFVFDAGYDPIALSHGLADVRCQLVVRLSSARVFYPDPPARPAGQRGRPPRHGPRFALQDPATHPPPDHQLTVTDPSYGPVHLQAWNRLHPKLNSRGRWSSPHLPIVAGTVIRVHLQHPPGNRRPAQAPLWLWWSGPGPPDLERCARAYLRRFHIEHGFRFFKSTLGWTTPKLCTPTQADRWTQLIAAAYTQLRLAQALVADHRLPWERPLETAQLTPNRVRRGFRRLRPTLATPTRPPKSHTPGPGRPKGTRRPPRTRHPPTKKAA